MLKMSKYRAMRNDEVYSKVVKAGKRTYFFDVKSTKGNDLYLTITESKKRFDEEGNARFEKHKIFLYKEDFDNFSEGMEDVIAKIKELQGQPAEMVDEKEVSLEFEDLN